MGRLDGKVAVVTGAARGLGEAYARAMAAEGANVLLTDVLEEGARTAESIGSTSAFKQHDVTSRAEWDAAIAEAEKQFGPVSVLVNNAGIFAGGPLETMSEAAFRRSFDINVVGVFIGMQSVIPSMRRAGGGSIINASSTAGMAGFAMATAYGGSKYAVRGMSKCAALELGSDNIRVNSIHPGVINTQMTEGFSVPDNQPIPRLGRPEEVAKLVVFLASDEASYCTGAEYLADGGQTTLVGAMPATPF